MSMDAKMPRATTTRQPRSGVAWRALAIDTCFARCAVALAEQRAAIDVVACEAQAMTRGHAAMLAPMIEKALRDTAWSPSDIDLLAVTIGPGSFTGVRVGVAAARALSLATGKPAVGMTSLAVMADEARRQLGEALAGRAIAVAVDARAGMVYLQVFRDKTDAAPQLLDPVAAAAAIGMQPTVLVGSGAPMLAPSLAATGGRTDVALTDLQPHARSLAERAVALNPEGVLRPLYIRRPDVKEQGDKSLPRVSS
jgi:tRNA threonylcarbamoyladenosine biosynthesis protein TsaB